MPCTVFNWSLQKIGKIFFHPNFMNLCFKSVNFFFNFNTCVRFADEYLHQNWRRRIQKSTCSCFDIRIENECAVIEFSGSLGLIQCPMKIVCLVVIICVGRGTVWFSDVISENSFYRSSNNKWFILQFYLLI